MKTKFLLSLLLLLVAGNACCQEVNIVNLEDWDYVHHKGFKVVATTSGYMPGDEVMVYFHIDNMTNWRAGETPNMGEVSLYGIVGGTDEPEQCVEVPSGDIPVFLVSVGGLCAMGMGPSDRFTIIVDVEGVGVSPGDQLILGMHVFTADNDPGQQIVLIAK